MELEHLFNKADEILVEINNKKFKVKEAVQYVRTGVDRDILNVCCHLNDLSIEQMNLLGTKTRTVKFSIDSLLKNRINHPELSLNDYKRINEIIINPDEIKVSKNKRNSILLFRKYNKIYQAVIKTTLSKEENFLTSFRFAEH